MSIGTNTPRLLAAAKEFNIGKDTLVEYLQSKNFDIDASKPNTKLTAEMYNALQGEFAQDKAVKLKSDEIALPKAGMMDNAKKKEEQEPARFKKEESVETTPIFKQSAPSEEKEEVPEPIEMQPEIPAPKEEVSPEKEAEEAAVVVPEEKTEQPETIQEKAIPEVPKEEPKPKVIEEKVTPAPEETKAIGKAGTTESETHKEAIDEPAEVKKETETSEEIKNEATEETELEHIETKSPKLEGPKILDKIDLSNLNLSTRPKKGVGKKIEEKKKTEVKKPIEKKVETPITKPAITISKPIVPPPPAPIIKKAEQEEIVREHIEMKAPKLEGPKVIGKIELPVNTVGGKQERKEKRKRKRIPVDKKPVTRQTGTTGVASSGTPGARPAGTGTPGQNRDNRSNPNNRNQGTGSQRPRTGVNDRRRPLPGRTATGTPQEIDAKEIQEKIRETQAKLAGGGSRNRNLKAKYRRNKREEMAEKRAAEENSAGGKTIQVTEFISVSELANLLDVSFADIISKCMNLGIMVSINQRLDAEVIELVASEFDTDVEFINLDDGAEEEEEEVEDEANLVPRAPVVTIMGHVDHGKTSLLDYIRSATVVAGEAGGITQHIGAYRVTTEAGKNLTFLDTPGHEAFTAMRARGAKAADVAVIVIAADDAIMPQTKEAISHAQAAGLPMVFAINKIDKEGANPEKIKEQLSAMNILVEDWGGSFQSQEISAKKGLNINLLLDKILLEAELLELKSNPDREAIGLTIEASLDKGRGYVTTVLVQGGKLRAGDMIVAGQYYGKVKAMTNERGQKVKEAGPSTPVQVLGLNGAPQAGEKFKVYQGESDAKSVANHRAQIMREQGLRTRKHITLDEIGRRLALGNFKELNVIIKADFDGSAEALSDSLQKLSTEEIVVNVVLKGVGQITESDVMLASASDAIILGFQVRPSIQASRLADQENIEIRHYSIIYDAIAEIKSAMEGMLEPKFEKKIVGNIEIREVFKISGVGSIAGCYVLDGKFQRSTRINIIREGIVVHTGELASLKRFKDDVKEVSAGYECGLSIKNYNDIRVGDVIEGYEEVEIKRKL